jgi:hypothetical protein
MRNTIILNTLILTLCLCSSNLTAQFGKTSLSLGGGQFFKKTISEKTSPNVNFGGITTTQTTTTFMPHFALILERRISNSLSIGGGFNYLTAQSTDISTSSFAGGATTTFQQDSKFKMGGVSINPKLFFYSDDDFDVYAGAGLGLLMSYASRSARNIVGGINQVNFAGSDGGDLKTLLDINIGGRCFLTENLGFYGEVGYVALYLRKAVVGKAGVFYRF